MSIKSPPDAAVRRLPERPATPAEILGDIRRLGLKTPAEASRLVRAHRDRR
jgi:hypothetical protein